MQNETTMFMTAPTVRMKELKNLFFQLSSKTCNLKCKYCYIEKNEYKNQLDFMDFEKIKSSLLNLKNHDLNSIYLTGGEPLMHPDFNKILRMCLKFSNVTVLTNGVLINDKKARFLRKIDDESKFETIFRISLDSPFELENDAQRGRGSCRHAISAILSLLKYEFNPIISTVNYKNKPKEQIFDEFKTFFSKKGFMIEDINLKIIPYFSKDNTLQAEEINPDMLDRVDCASSRIVSNSGVYSCPMLCDDYRARVGSSLEDYSKINYLDCEKCCVCAKSMTKIMINDWM